MGNWKKAGGGFLNGTAGTIVGGKFSSTEWPAQGKKAAYSTFSAELLITPDGADAPVQQFLRAGFFNEGTELSDDALSLEADGSTPVQEGSEFARFIDSLEAAGFDMTAIIESEYKDFTSIINWRVQFEKVVDKEATEKFGKRKAKKGAHKGKEFNRDYLAVSKVFEQVAAKKGSKGAAKATAAKGATKGKAKVDDDDAEEAAKGVLLGILADAKNNTILKGTLSSAITKYCLSNDMNDQREAVRKVLTDSFIAEMDGVEVDAKAKTISLA